MSQYLLPGLGKIISSTAGGSGHTKAFVIAGSSHDELALLHVFAQSDINDLLLQKCYKLSSAVREYVPGSLTLPIYTDISRVTTIKTQIIMDAIIDQPNRMIGKLHKRDLENIVLRLYHSETLSKEILHKYFSGK